MPLPGFDWVPPISCGLYASLAGLRSPRMGGVISRLLRGRRRSPGRWRGARFSAPAKAWAGFNRSLRHRAVRLRDMQRIDRYILGSPTRFPEEPNFYSPRHEPYNGWSEEKKHHFPMSLIDLIETVKPVLAAMKKFHPCVAEREKITEEWRESYHGCLRPKIAQRPSRSGGTYGC